MIIVLLALLGVLLAFVLVVRKDIQQGPRCHCGEVALINHHIYVHTEHLHTANGCWSAYDEPCFGEDKDDEDSD